ncbi:hypothetical protein GCM10023081_44190 [Arthrobacter ginkgonis]|uniref:Uncharacterized protein n=1 Tax=Arthrobacter ginkgonis TaxID=1630594 RepID=A0ABP7DFM5_9MICC
MARTGEGAPSAAHGGTGMKGGADVAAEVSGGRGLDPVMRTACHRGRGAAMGVGQTRVFGTAWFSEHLLTELVKRRLIS